MTVRYNCPHCSHLFVHKENIEGLAYCTNCRKLFIIPPKWAIPAWIWGVLAIMIANWQILCRF